MSSINGTLRIDPGSILDDHVANTTRLNVDKLQHVYKPSSNFALAIGGTPVSREEIVFTATQTGVIRGFHSLLNACGTVTSIAFDLKKNGVSILTGVVTLTNATGNRISVAGTLANTALAAGDVLSISMAVTTSTGAQGPFAWVDVTEQQAP